MTDVKLNCYCYIEIIKTILLCENEKVMLDAILVLSCNTWMTKNRNSYSYKNQL